AVRTCVLAGTLSRSMPPVGGCSGAAWTGAAGAAFVWRGGAGAGRGAARRGGSGDGAITVISGSTVWPDAPDRAIDSPAAIAGTITDARRPHRQVSRFLTSPPCDASTTPPASAANLIDSRLSVAGSSCKSERELLAMRPSRAGRLL